MTYIHVTKELRLKSFGNQATYSIKLAGIERAMERMHERHIHLQVLPWDNYRTCTAFDRDTGAMVLMLNEDN